MFVDKKLLFPISNVENFFEVYRIIELSNDFIKYFEFRKIL